MKHTPGPWIIEKRVNTFSFVINSDNPRKCIADSWDINTGPIETEANARLIAAAPELLEALKDLYAQACGMPKSCGHDFTCICPGDKAKAAIAKAEGK